MRRHWAAAVVLAGTLAFLLSAGCGASRSEPACDRLQALSCQCFPMCQLEYSSTIDSQDATACQKAIDDAYSYWKRCAGTCTANCEYGWGSCALSRYRAAGKSADHACPGRADAGSDGG